MNRQGLRGKFKIIDRNIREQMIQPQSAPSDYTKNCAILRKLMRLLHVNGLPRFFDQLSSEPSYMPMKMYAQIFSY